MQRVRSGEGARDGSIAYGVVLRSEAGHAGSRSWRKRRGSDGRKLLCCCLLNAPGQTPQKHGLGDHDWRGSRSVQEGRLFEVHVNRSKGDLWLYIIRCDFIEHRRRESGT